MIFKIRILVGALLAFRLLAQDPASMLLDALQAKQSAGGSEFGTAGPMSDGLPSNAVLPTLQDSQSQAADQAENTRLNQEVRDARQKDKTLNRFASDLFDIRQYGINPTDGGIAEDYVLGIGDRLQLNVVGSANFETPLQVDGRGVVAIPRVGTVPVAGLSLAMARSAVQTKVARLFSRANVDLSVTKLREVRVFVLGEVYKPGAYLIPSLSSIVNILSLAGGPTGIGTYRDIRVIRGGGVIHSVDLYPLRAEGLGNLNFGFQNGDTIFVPLAHNQVRLEGGFTRVVATVPEPEEGQLPSYESQEIQKTQRMIEDLTAQLGRTDESTGKQAGGVLGLGKADGAPAAAKPSAALMNALKASHREDQQDAVALSAAGPAMDKTVLADRLDLLQRHLAELKASTRADQRLNPDGPYTSNELDGQPAWLFQWLEQGRAPFMLFEMLPGETAKDAVALAGGVALNAFSGSLTLRRIDPSGALTVANVPEGEAMAKCALQKGDVLTALPLRDFDGKSVTVKGWVRIPGVFARKDGQGAGDFLKGLSLLLPDTYLERAELVRTLPDGSKRYFSFNVAKALRGDAGHNLPLENRDTLELYRIGDLRLPLTLTVNGPVTRPGLFEFIPGMRASDLLFRAGVPLRSANEYVAELAHTVDGKTEQVTRLDLARLVSREDGSPVDLKDDRVNPPLEPFDQITLFGKPDYREHRSITLSGQVVRPGVYELESFHTTLREVLERAGGLTPEAMPEGGIYLRQLGGLDPEKQKANELAGVTETDPTSNGVNEVLKRLAETTRLPLTGDLMASPLLHGLTSGTLNRLVVDWAGLLSGDASAQVELRDGDQVIFPRKTEVAYVVGETASPFSSFKVERGMKVKDLLKLAGGPTRNADTRNIRLLKADGRIMDSWVGGKVVEPGDAVLVPQRIRRDVSWQENLTALTPVAIMINALRN